MANEYYVEKREFSMAEIHILMDAVQAASFITEEKTAQLVDKIAELAGSRRAEAVKQNVVAFNTLKSPNEDIFAIVSIISDAIEKYRKIEFMYFDYDLSGNRVYRKENKIYKVNPVSTIFSDDKYYLLCYDDKHGNLAHYRIDRMANVKISNEDITPSDCSEVANVQKHKKQVFGMYHGQETTVTFEVNNKLIDVILDKFGYEIRLYRSSEDTFRFTADVQISPVFLGWCCSFGGYLKVTAPNEIVTVLDQACGTGGMLSTAYSYFKHINSTCDVRLFGQEYMPDTYAIGLAEMLIKGQDSRNFRHADTFKVDCFADKPKMRFVLENPPFGTPWSGKDAKDGQEKAVKDEYDKRMRGEHCRWAAGLPSGGDSQLIFMQSAIDKMDDRLGRAAIISNGSPLFTGSTASGESQIRRWLLESDLIEAIIALPTDLFYNTGIQTYVWILSKNKRKERIGKVQLIDASAIYHKLRKTLGNKKNELSPEDRKRITELYANFEENELVKIFDNTEFLYREYSVYQPLQRSYEITEESIENMISKGTLSSIYDEGKVFEMENSLEPLDDKEKKKLQSFYDNKPLFDSIIARLRENVSDNVYMNVSDFEPVLYRVMAGFDKKIIVKLIDGLSKMNKSAVIQRDKKGNIIYDKETKDIEIVRYDEDISDYMKREVLPHVPDAKAFFEENLTAKKPVIKVGAEIPFTRYFYKYQQPEKSEVLEKEFLTIEKSVSEKIKSLFG